MKGSVCSLRGTEYCGSWRRRRKRRAQRGTQKLKRITKFLNRVQEDLGEGRKGGWAKSGSPQLH
jgi:hypothetical protein